MSLRILVCIKQVSNPDYFSELTLDPVTGSISRDKVPSILNPMDENALEEALKIKDKQGATVTVLTMGPPSANEILEWGLSLGADEGVLLSDPAFAGADSWATALALAMYIKRSELPDLIFCGNSTVDGGTAQVGPQIAEILDIPHISSVNEFTISEEKTVEAKHEIEYGGYLKIKAKMPVLVSVTESINQVRDVTAEGIMSLFDKEIKTFNAKEIEADEELIGLKGSPTRVAGCYIQESDRKAEILDNTSPEEIAQTVIRQFKEIGIL